MSWILPEHEARTFARNPLQAVICQLRFDPILKMEGRVADFQDRIRVRFPGYEEIDGQLVDINIPLRRVLPRAVRQYRFLARKEPTAVELGDESVSLEYRKHRERKVLFEDASLVFGALSE